MPPRKLMALVWYYPDQWTRIKEVSADRDEMCDTYAQWLAGAEKDVREYQAEGIEVHRVHVDVDLLVAWAAQKGLRIDGHNRSAFAAELLIQRIPPERQS